MTSKLDFRALAFALFVAGLISYLLCIVGDVLFGWTMYQVWAPLLPGFTWPLTLGGFLIGLLWLVLYSIYAAALIVWSYNLAVRREAA